MEIGCTSKMLQCEMWLIVDRQDDSADHEKCVCSGLGFQHTCLLCISVALIGATMMKVKKYGRPYFDKV